MKIGFSNNSCLLKTNEKERNQAVSNSKFGLKSQLQSDTFIKSHAATNPVTFKSSFSELPAIETYVKMALELQEEELVRNLKYCFSNTKFVRSDKGCIFPDKEAFKELNALVSGNICIFPNKEENVIEDSISHNENEIENCFNLGNRVAEAAVQTILGFGEPRHIKVLEPFLDDSNRRVRMGGALGIQGICNKAGIECPQKATDIIDKAIWG